MPVVSMKELLESGVHFGHRTHKWHPKMKSYIFTERNQIHIIDLQQTVKALEEAYGMIRDRVAEGGNVLFIGTKRQAQETIQLEATRCGMPWVTARWLGGTLTNWVTIRQRINELERLERMRERGDFALLTKKEALGLERKIDRLEMLLGGIRNMVSVPEIIFVVDVRREDTAIHEANLLGIPVVAMVDTNCDPRNVDYIIPSNDDAIRAIKLIVRKVADAVLEGQAMRKDLREEMPVETAAAFDIDAELTDADLLGAATLAKLEAQRLEEAEEAEPADAVEAEDVDVAEEAGEPEVADEAEEADETETSDEVEETAEGESAQVEPVEAEADSAAEEDEVEEAEDAVEAQEETEDVPEEGDDEESKTEEDEAE
jgi:small subunit ribosomal protein S2